MYEESLTLKSFDIHDTTFPHVPYKLLPTTKNILGARRFFSLFLCFFHFHRTLFRGLAGVLRGLAGVLRGLAGVLRESRKFFQTLFLYIHLFVY